MSNLSIISRHRILYVSTQMVSFQSVAIVHQYPGGVVNRIKSTVRLESSDKGGCKVEDLHSLVY